MIGKCLSEKGCDGIMEAQRLDYPLQRGRRKIIVPAVEVWVCTKCGERVFPYESSRQIEAYRRYSGTVSLRIDPPLHADLAERARKSHRSLNEEITHLLKSSIQQTAPEAV
jgi:YgiT-type zinc finger domain-containing protein